jgi:hypothetical protein
MKIRATVITARTKAQSISVSANPNVPACLRLIGTILVRSQARFIFHEDSKTRANPSNHD